MTTSELSLLDAESASVSLIDFLKEQDCLNTLDIVAASWLSKGEESFQLVLAYLFCASRQGHLCVEVSPQLKPPLSQLWPMENVDYQPFEDQILVGARLLKQCPNSLITFKEDRLYLKRNELLENEIKELFLNVEQDIPQLEVGEVLLSDTTSVMQRQAVEKSLRSCLSFITGGPGVGKTYTAYQLTRAFLQLFPQARLALVAPTGKAVSNLQNYFSQSGESNKLHAMTLHRLFYHEIDSYLPYDLILVDESSMVDAPLILKLLKHYKPRSRLIFLGDPDQLPPVGSGSIFCDLLKMSQSKSELTECLRTDIKDILQSAQSVKMGEASCFIEGLEKRGALFPLPSPQDLATHFLSKIAPQREETLLQKLNGLSRYKILTPMRRGVYGSEFLNELLKKNLPTSYPHPIIIGANNYRLDLFNGDIGFIHNFEEAIFFARGSEQSHFDPQEGVRRIPLALLPSYELAHCLSVHKSQGSEYEKVSILIPPGSEAFGRELLYTALTRAKKDLEVFSNSHTLERLVKNKVARISGLSS